MSVAAPISADSPTASRPFWKDKSFIRVLLFIVPTMVFSALVTAVIGLKFSYMLKDQLNLTASELSTFNLILGLPTYLQPFVGMYTDMFAFFGYHRRSYYMAGKLIGAAGMLGIAAFEGSGGLAHSSTRAYLTVACIWMVVVAAGVMRTVIFNAIMVALGNVTGRFGQLVAAVQLIPIVMAIGFTAHLGGYIAQNWSYPQAFIAGALLTLLSIPLVFLIDEKRTSQKRHANESAAEHIERTELKAQDRKKTAAAIRKEFSSPAVWVLVGFVFYLILTPGINNAKFYFESNQLHFSKQFMGDLGKYVNWGALAGYFLYGLISRRIPVYMLAWGAWLMDCFGYTALLLLHDKQSAMILEFMFAVIGAVYNVCLFTLAARMCPKGLEGVIYGLVMASIAFAGTLSEKIGAWIYDFYGPVHHYSLVHGWNWSLYFGFGFTVIAVVFIPFLPAWTRSRKLLGEMTDASVDSGLAEPTISDNDDSNHEDPVPRSHT